MNGFGTAALLAEKSGWEIVDDSTYVFFDFTQPHDGIPSGPARLFSGKSRWPFALLRISSLLSLLHTLLVGTSPVGRLSKDVLPSRLANACSIT